MMNLYILYILYSFRLNKNKLQKNKCIIYIQIFTNLFYISIIYRSNANSIYKI